MAVSTSGPALGLDIVCYKGDTFERWIRIRRNGVEEDLQPSTFRMQIRNNTLVVKEISSASSDGQITVEIGGGGVLVLTIPASVSAALPSGTFQFDIQQTYPDGKVRTRLRGSFTITDDITKPIS